MTFMGARGRSGFDLFAASAKLGRRMRCADLVITGEGAMDASTLMGKGVGEVARLCRQLKVSCIGLAGRLGDESKLKKHFFRAGGLTELTSVENAKAAPVFWLELAELAARYILLPGKC